MPSNKKLLQAAAGNAGESLYVEDVFSTYLYEGNGSTQSIDNGIDLDGEGGMVWTKWRSGYYTSRDNNLWDTERGTTPYLNTNNTAAEKTSYTNAITYNSNGFTLNNQFPSNMNFGGEIFASWTFRKAKKFFDVVTYTGDGVAGRTVAHNLGSVPGCIIVKKLNAADQWAVQHKSLTATHNLILERTDAATDDDAYWYDIEPTSTEFTVGYDGGTNGNGGSYVAYLFASDAGGFGDDGDESIIKCGSYTGNGSSSGPTIDLGFEPQFVMIKAATNYTSGNWLMLDTMRGWTANSGNQTGLYANLSDAEIAANSGLSPTATGFQIKDTTPQINGSGNTYIYIAIRRPMKTPESGTEVFATDTRGSTGDGNAPTYRSPFPVDMQFNRNRTYAGGDTTISARLTQANQMFTNLTNAESANAAMMFDYMNGVQTDTGTNTAQSAWMFKRATGFFDVVAYTGTGSTQAVNHNLGAIPELMIIKVRDATQHWAVYNPDLPGSGKFISLNNNWDGNSTNSTFWDGNTPSSTTFTVGTSNNYVNGTSSTYIAYLFATLAGVSKVGSYTGTGTSQTIDCGFSGGARFILIKSTSTTGSWWVYDSVRGIVAGNDPALQLNSTAAEVTSADAIDPDSSGFIVNQEATCSINASGVSYIFMSIA